MKLKTFTLVDCWGQGSHRSRVKAMEPGLLNVDNTGEPLPVTDTRVSLLELCFRKRTPMSVWRSR